MSAEVRYALTLHRPWHAAVILGPKCIENRSWPPPKSVGGATIAIHAGKKWDDSGAVKMNDILGRIGFVRDDAFWAMQSEGGLIVGVATVHGYIHDGTAPRTKLHEDPWFFGPYGWVLTNRRPLARPVPAKGAQRLWRLTPDERAAVESQLTEGTNQ